MFPRRQTCFPKAQAYEYQCENSSNQTHHEFNAYEGNDERYSLNQQIRIHGVEQPQVHTTDSQIVYIRPANTHPSKFKNVAEFQPQILSKNKYSQQFQQSFNALNQIQQEVRTQMQVQQPIALRQIDNVPCRYIFESEYNECKLVLNGLELNVNNVKIVCKTDGNNQSQVIIQANNK